MKKFFLTLTLIVSFLAFTGCKDDDNEPAANNELVNTTWEFTDDEPDYYIYETISFKSQSKCVYTLVEKEDGKTVSDISVTGSYSYNPPVVTIKMSYQGDNQTMKMTISGNKMIGEDGYTFTRKK